jgi:hypothetical protein
MKLSIIIVNYKTPQLVLDCIASVCRFSTEGTEIIVVDNFSGDNTETLLQQHYPDVKWLQMNYNAGFARANNAGISIAKGDVVLLLNSDTIVKDDAVNNATNKLMASPAYVACGVQLLNEDGSPQISGNYAMKGGVNYLLPLPFMGKFLKALASLLKIKKPNVPNASGMVDVDWINGAFLMVKKSAIEQAGLLDGDFFLYAEEAEWCSRLKKTGKLCIYGDEHVEHLQGGSANDAFESAGKGYFNLFDRKGLQIMLSNFVRIRKEFGLGWFFFDLIVYLITIPVFFFGVLFQKIFFVKNNAYNFSQFAGFVKNIFSVLKFVPKIVSNKPYFYKVL